MKRLIFFPFLSIHCNGKEDRACSIILHLNDEQRTEWIDRRKAIPQELNIVVKTMQLLSCGVEQF
jgi:hypothetical protein